MPPSVYSIWGTENLRDKVFKVFVTPCIFDSIMYFTHYWQIYILFFPSPLHLHYHRVSHFYPFILQPPIIVFSSGLIVVVISSYHCCCGCIWCILCKNLWFDVLWFVFWYRRSQLLGVMNCCPVWWDYLYPECYPKQSSVISVFNRGMCTFRNKTMIRYRYLENCPIFQWYQYRYFEN